MYNMSFISVATMPDPKIMKAPLRSPAAQTLVHDEKIKPRYVQEAIDELVKKEGVFTCYMHTCILSICKGLIS